MARYQAGQLDQRIELQRYVEASDGMGGGTAGWETYATVWAYVRPRSGREVPQADQITGPAIYLFAIRNRRGVELTDRILWNGYQFNVRHVADMGSRAHFLEIDAEKGVAQ